MDKSTLSNYGWIVIAVLVLSVMIALATPFGSYIEQGVRSTTQGLFDTSEKALNIVGMTAGTGNFENGYQGGASNEPEQVELSYCCNAPVYWTPDNVCVNCGSVTFDDCWCGCTETTIADAKYCTECETPC